MLEYNKLYQSLKKVSAEWHAGNVQWGYYWDYLKFFGDGTVIEASINSEDFERINSNFIKGSTTITHGQFTLNRTHISLEFDKTILSGELANDNKIILRKSDLSWEIYSLI